MILGLFVLFGIVVVTFLVYLAGDEVMILHETPGVNSSIFRQELNELLVMVPFMIMASITIFNLYLITLEQE